MKLSENVIIKLGDCLELMKDIEDCSIDMILCDLPYGVTSNPLDEAIPFKPLWKCYKRIIKDNGAIVLFAQGIFYVDLINSNRKMFRYDLIWNKILTSGFLNANRMPLRSHEQLAIFYKHLPTYNPQFTDGEPLHSKGTSYKNKKHKNQNYGKFEITNDVRKGSIKKNSKSIMEFRKPHPSVSKHRTQKPIDLCEYLIKTYTNAGDIVLDNCAGSFTTGVAAINVDRKFIGYEINKQYFELGKNNLLNAIEYKHKDQSLKDKLL